MYTVHFTPKEMKKHYFLLAIYPKDVSSSRPHTSLEAQNNQHHSHHSLQRCVRSIRPHHAARQRPRPSRPARQDSREELDTFRTRCRQLIRRSEQAVWDSGGAHALFRV
jgi:hypothetical protein